MKIVNHFLASMVPKPANKTMLPNTKSTNFITSFSTLKLNPYAIELTTKVKNEKEVSGNLLKVFTIKITAKVPTKAWNKPMMNSPPSESQLDSSCNFLEKSY